MVRDCYDSRRSDQVSCFKLLGAQGQAGYKDFQGFAKLLGKLGKPIAAARSFVTAALTLPVDFVEGFKIEIVPSSAPRKVPLSQTLAIEEIMHKIFTSQDEREKYLDRLRKLTNEESFSAILKRKCKFDAFVHAELLLLNHFYKDVNLLQEISILLAASMRATSVTLTSRTIQAISRPHQLTTRSTNVGALRMLTAKTRLSWH